MSVCKKSFVLVYVDGFVGNEGTKQIIVESKNILYNRFSDEYIDKIFLDCENSINKKFEKSLILKIDGFIPSFCCKNNDNQKENCENKIEVIDSCVVEKGGVLASLWKILEKNNLGIEYMLNDIPILQGTIEICNYFDLNPYRLLTSNVKIYLINFLNFFEDENDAFTFINSYNLNNDKNYGSFIGICNNRKKRIRIDCETESFLAKDFKDEINRIKL